MAAAEALGAVAEKVPWPSVAQLRGQVQALESSGNISSTREESSSLGQGPTSVLPPTVKTEDGGGAEKEGYRGGTKRDGSQGQVQQEGGGKQAGESEGEGFLSYKT